ncbi:MAG: primosomal protein N' [Methylohalobius sp.]|nr:primosomal protein N' [Methylohalobius sp.]
MSIILKVAIPAPLRKALDYLPPASQLDCLPIPGVRLKVPFGSKSKIGVLLEVKTESKLAPSRLRQALEYLDREPLLGPADLALLRWVARYYHHPVGEVCASALPTLLRQSKPARSQTPIQLRLTPSGQTATLPPSAKRQAALLSLLRQHDGKVTVSDLTELGWNWRPVAKALAAKGWIQIEQAPSWAVIPPCPFALNPAQRQAIATVTAEQHRFGVYLLEGVTGSGKTEVYLGIIEKTLQLGRQALVLLPEIALTPQLQTRFLKRLACPVGVYHSGLSENERLAAWLGFQRGELPVLLGTRSAVFIPMAKPGLIVVDEEHDPSFKQQEGFRFSARDVAVARALQLGIPIVLGSATPALESLYNASQGRYVHLHLPERAGGAQAPTLKLVDIRGARLQAGLAPAVLEAIRITLERREQVLLFLNRRGFAPVLTCYDCGWVAGCPHCAARLCLHRRDRRLCCHHCGHQRPLFTHCPTCGAKDLHALGRGTERLEDELADLFPYVRVARLDRDATRRRGSLEQLIEAIRAREVDILLGTQILAKGHHFPEVTLTVVVEADAGLYSTDFRAPERMAQLIMQVAGRCGRGTKPGQVLIQTRHPNHPLLTALLQGGYSAFATQALKERRQADLPPYSHQALLRAEAHAPDLPECFLGQAAHLARELAHEHVQVLGPAPSPVPRRAGRYRAQLLFQSPRRPPLHRLLARLLPALDDLPHKRRVRWSLDVDPVTLD